MTATTRPDAGAPRGPAPRDPVGVDARRAWYAIGVFTAVAAVARIVLAWKIESPFLYHDEGGYLAVSRWLVGSPPELYGPEYSTGYGVLLAPLAQLLDPGQLHHAGQLLNVAAAAACVPIAHLIGTRVLGLAPWTSAVVAVVGTTTAASIVQTTMLLPEQLLVLCTLCTALGVHETVRRSSARWAVVTGALGGLSYGLHARSLVVPIALALVAGFALRSGSMRPRSAVAMVVSAVVPVAAFQAVQVQAAEQLYPIGAWIGVQRTPPGSLAEIRGTALIGVGQVWYVLVATAGIGLAGWLAAAGAARRRGSDGPSAVAIFVSLGFLGALGLAAIASYGITLNGRVPRPDQTVYGRYVETWIPLLVLHAPLLLARLRARLLALVGLVVAAAGVIARAGFPDGTWSQPIAWHNVASLRLPIEWFGDDFVIAASLVIGAALVVVALVMHVEPRAVVVPVALMVALNLAGGPRLVDRWAAPASVSWADRHRLGPVLERVGEPVAVDATDVLESFWAYNAQYWHPEIDIEMVREGASSSARLRIDSILTPPVPGAILVGRERDGDLGLWALDPAAAAAVEAAGGAPGVEPG